MLRGLRASGEPSRLRLLGVLALGEFTVSELTGILGQSQPRVSRHLKLLSDCGMLERFREQHWVFYRLPSEGEGAVLARALLALLDRDDPVVKVDRERADAVLAARTGPDQGDASHAEGGAAAMVRELAEAAAAELGESAFDAVLYVGGAPAEMLRVIGPRARRAHGLSASRPEVQRARATLHGNGLSHCVLRQGRLPEAVASGASYDVVLLDRVLAGTDRRSELLRDAARVLRREGKLMVIEEYDALSARAGDGNPLTTVRNWIAGSGLVCERLHPTDAGTTHVLLATASAERPGRPA